MPTPNQMLKRLQKRRRYLSKLIDAQRLPPPQHMMCVKEREALEWALPLLARVVGRPQERRDGAP